MAEPFLSEIRIMSFASPRRVGAVQRAAAADQPEPGAVLAARDDVRRRRPRNFALPDLRGRTPIHVGSGHTLGERGGEQAHTLSIAELPEHAHVANATTAQADAEHQQPDERPSAGAVELLQPLRRGRQPAGDGPNALGHVGGSQAHLNMQPFLTLSFCIALQGIFPSPN